MEKWSEQKAWEWYNKLPWKRGCNFMGSDCANRIDQWQEYGFEERMKTVERELDLAAQTGFNSMRIVVDYNVYQAEHDGFMKRFDRYLETIYKYGMDSVVVLLNGCHVPKGKAKPVKMGPQTYDIGYHGGKKVSPHARRTEESFYPTDDPELAPKYYQMAEEIMKEHKNDERVLAWNLFNEPGNGKKDMTSTIATLDRLAEIAWSIRPAQPVMIDVWDDLSEDENGFMTEINKYSISLSDVISFHEYGNFERTVRMISWLKQYNRPLMCTEWLHRIINNNLEELFPLFMMEKIASYNWGLVAGKYQTYEPWELIWQSYEQGNGDKYDFTKWQHDLFRPNLRPYNPKETELIKRTCEFADKLYGKQFN